MGKYLKVFDLTSEYQTYVNGPDVILPNVSKCKDDNTKVYYNPYVPNDPYNGHDYVEIGGLKWATMNVGANSITDYGLYFQWGDTQGYTADQVGSSVGQKHFEWIDYKYGNGTNNPNMIKYNSTDGKTVLDLEDDAVRAAWGGEWRMPTTDEYVALGAACDFIDSNGTIITSSNKITTLDGVSGILIADKTDHNKRLFFPVCGYCANTHVQSIGTMGGYWSSSIYPSQILKAYTLDIYSGGVNWHYYYAGERSKGFSIRGIAD